MKVNSIGNSYGIYDLYSAMFQNSSALKNNKLYQSLLPANKAQNQKSIGESALSYVSNIKSASKKLSASLNALSGPAFLKTKEVGKDAEKESEKSTVKDLEYAKSAVEDFVKNYNDLYSEAVQKSDDPKAQSLASRLLNTSKIYSGSLAGIGIGFDNDGMMKIDSKTLDASAENGKLETFFTQNRGKNYGFTNQLANLADNVTRNTSNYVSSSVLGNSLMENFSYSASGKTSQYSFLNAGWLFDYLF